MRDRILRLGDPEASGMTQAQIDLHNTAVRARQRIEAAVDVTPAYRRRIHPSTGEIRYYINNVEEVCGSRQVEAYVTDDGEVVIQSEPRDPSWGQAVRASVAAHPVDGSPVRWTSRDTDALYELLWREGGR